MHASVDIEALSQEIYNESAFVDRIIEASGRVIVGQAYMISRLLLGLLADGHVLLEGLPGLAKTLAIKTLASLCDGSFSRIQFTPDLLPADIIGTMIYNPAIQPVFGEDRVRFSPNLSSRMKSTVLLPKSKAHSWKPCRKDR